MVTDASNYHACCYIKKGKACCLPLAVVINCFNNLRTKKTVWKKSWENLPVEDFRFRKKKEIIQKKKFDSVEKRTSFQLKELTSFNDNCQFVLKYKELSFN